MIEKTAAYKVGELCFPSVQAAQRAALSQLIGRALAADEHDVLTDGDVPSILISNRQEVIHILSLSDNAPKRRKPRADKGKPRVKLFEKLDGKQSMLGLPRPLRHGMRKYMQEILP